MLSDEDAQKLVPEGTPARRLVDQARAGDYGYTLPSYVSTGIESTSASRGRHSQFDRAGLDPLAPLWMRVPQYRPLGWVLGAASDASLVACNAPALAQKLADAGAQNMSYVSVSVVELGVLTEGHAAPDLQSCVLLHDGACWVPASVSTAASQTGIPAGVPNDGHQRRFAGLDLIEQWTLAAQSRPELRLLAEVHMQTGLVE